MTTVFGLKPDDIEASILVADRQATYLNKDGMQASKILNRKLWASKDGMYGFGHSGFRDNELGDLIQKLSDNEIDVEKIIKEGYFPELRDLNIKRMGKKLPDNQNISGFILATRFENKPKLYTCFPLGSVEKRGWTTMGSGETKVDEYISALSIITESRDYQEHRAGSTIQDYIQIGLEAVRRAQSQDIYSHGLDMIICTPEALHDHYADLGDDFGNKLKKIQEFYKK